MYESAIQFIGLCVAFSGVAVAMFFIIGIAIDYIWRKMQEAVGFYRLAKCYRRVSRIVERNKARKGTAA